jgi:hypothetical protein
MAEGMEWEEQEEWRGRWVMLELLPPSYSMCQLL